MGGGGPKVVGVGVSGGGGAGGHAWRTWVSSSITTFRLFQFHSRGDFWLPRPSNPLVPDQGGFVGRAGWRSWVGGWQVGAVAGG